MTQQLGLVKISLVVLSLLFSNGVFAGTDDDDDDKEGQKAPQVVKQVQITEADRVHYWPSTLPREALDEQQKTSWEQSCHHQWVQWQKKTSDYIRAHAWAPRIQRSNPQGSCATLLKVVRAPFEMGGFIYDATVWDDFLNGRPVEEGIDITPYKTHFDALHKDYLDTVILPKAFQEFVKINRIALPPSPQEEEDADDHALMSLAILIGVSFSIIPH